MKPKVALLVLIPFLSAIVNALSYAWPIPDTGQTKCYDDVGNEISCPQPDERFYGQDGNYSINRPSYTKLDHQGQALPDDAASWVMVRDNVTGLIWEVKTNLDKAANHSDPHDADNTYSWYDSNPSTNGGYAGTPADGTDTEDFIKSLNDANFGGYSDWTLPTTAELFSIVDYGQYKPTINTTYFPNTGAYAYWSSESSIDNHWAREVSFNIGDGNSLQKSSALSVRAVRSDQSTASGRFVINGDGTVTDIFTGLMWQQETSTTMIWETALSHCEALTLAGYSDWRLPTITELQSIVDFSHSGPAIDTNYFPDTRSSHYTSSTTRVEEEMWYIDFSYGLYDSANKSGPTDVRAVRSGQNRVSGHLFISTPSQAVKWEIGDQRTIVWRPAGISGSVTISLSRLGGKNGTFEMIAEDVPNNGSYTWTVTGPESVNCALKIEPTSAPEKGTTQGLFTITSLIKAWITIQKMPDLGHYKVILNGQCAEGTWPLETTFSSSDPSTAAIDGNVLTALKNGYVEISAIYNGKTYRKGIFVYTTSEAAEIELNNTKSTANLMNEGGFYKGKILAEDEDWFKISLSSASLVNIGFLSYSGMADVRAEIFNPSDVLMASGLSLNGQALIFPLGLQAGNYYLRLSPEGDIDQSKNYVVSYKVLGELPGKNAVPILPGETKSGTVNKLTDQTDFTLILGEGQGVKILFIPSGDFGDYNIALLDGSESVLDQADCLDQLPVSWEAFYDAGAYTLRVTPLNTVDALSPFLLQVMAVTNPPYEKELNNTSAEATPFDISSPITGRLSTPEDSDFYFFSLDVPQSLAITFSCPGSGKDFSLSLYMESDLYQIDGLRILAGAGALNMELGPGEYFLRVAGDSSDVDTVHPYTLTINPSDQEDLEIEPNNSIMFVNGIDPGIAKKGRIWSDLDKDCYGFFLSDDAYFTVHFTPSTTTGDYKVSVMDENNTALESYTSSDGLALDQELYNLPRNYYICIEPNGDIDQNHFYELSVSYDTVALPALSPEQGTYTSTQDIMISCATDGASIRYTTDGSEPTESSNLYTGSVHVSADTILKAKGFKQYWVSSSISTGEYNISRIKGDIDGDDKVDLSDAILILRFLLIGETQPYLSIEIDVDGDRKIGLEEVIYILMGLSKTQ